MNCQNEKGPKRLHTKHIGSARKNKKVNLRKEVLKWSPEEKREKEIN